MTATRRHCSGPIRLCTGIRTNTVPTADGAIPPPPGTGDPRTTANDRDTTSYDRGAGTGDPHGDQRSEL